MIIKLVITPDHKHFRTRTCYLFGILSNLLEKLSIVLKYLLQNVKFIWAILNSE